VLITTDLVSCLLLLSIPLAAPFGGPGFPHLCLVAFGVGTMTVVAEVAHYAYVPALVGRERLTEANSKLQISYSAASAAGPGLAGALIQLLSAPVAVLADAASFLLSAVLLRSVRRPEPPREGSGARQPLARSIADGLRMLLGHPLLRAIIVVSMPISFFSAGFLAIYVLYATRELGLGPAMIGGWFLAAAASLLVPLAAGPTVVVVVVLATSRALEGITDTVANIHQWSLRQIVTPITSRDG
jgi:Major Facilitator Superfamily